MTLLSLLLALLVERVTTKTDPWRAHYYIDRYVSMLIEKQWLNAKSDLLGLLAIIGVPFLITLWLQNWLGNGFLGLLFNAAVLFICIGCPKLRATYKCYLQAADRGDAVACELHADSLGHEPGDSRCDSFAQHLVWLNYTHYAAIIIGFILFGAAGALLYVLALGVVSHIRNEQASENDIEAADFNADDNARVLSNANHLMWFIDFIPVRITALGFLLVGHFGRALPVWLHYLFDLSVSAKTLLCNVSSAAEDVEAADLDETLEKDDLIVDKHLSEPKILVKLAKRNIIFLMVAVSLLTMMGAIA